jgi:hypothetical protein
MTYYVQRRDFYPGDVADGEHLMNELFQSSDTIEAIDQNNIASNGINHTVAVPSNSSTAGDRHRGPFGCYNSTQLLYSSAGVVVYTSMSNGKFIESASSLTFTSRHTAVYTFFLQAIGYRSSSHAGPLKLDAALFLNGSKVESMQASFSGDRSAGNVQVPVFFSASEVLYPNDWTVTPAFRARCDDGNMPDILEVCFGVAGFIR